MRKASSDFGIIVLDDRFVGFALGHDYCAEHEWGIKGIKDMCGMPEGTNKNMGIICRSTTKCPSLIFKEDKKTVKKVKVHGAMLFTGHKYRSQEENEKYIPRDLEGYIERIQSDVAWEIEHPNKNRDPKDPIITAWSGNDFGIAVIGDKEVEYLKELHQAFEKKNITIAMTNLGAFGGSSLCILIKDRVPAEVAKQMYDADKEYYDRIDYEEKIGMAQLVEKHRGAGHHKLHYFMACSPKWIDYNDAKKREEHKKNLNTKYDIQYWINYSDDDNNYGWYTVEEIREWFTGNKKLTEIRKA